MNTPRLFLFLAISCLIIASIPLPSAFSQTPQLIDPLIIPKFVNQLDGPTPVYTPTAVNDNSGKLIRQDYTVRVSEFTQQILPTHYANGLPTDFPATQVWGYEGEAYNPVTCESLGTVKSTPGCTFEVMQGVPVQVKWVNNLLDATGNPLNYKVRVDPTLHWANPNNLQMDTSTVAAQASVPIVTHLHGGETPSASDGHPEGWWTADGKHGPAYNTVEAAEANSAVFNYPNGQQPTTLWYHDHALGLTRLNVLSGLAGFYLIRNTSDPIETSLPTIEYEVPLALQDRTFLTDGSLYYPTEGVNPEIHPYWQNFFLGNTIIVNGKAWPNLNVKQGQYRFRILDGCNSRFYNFSFSNNMPFTLIGTEGGYVKTPVQLTSMLLAPAERADILVDFSNVPAGQKIVLENFAGALVENDARTTGLIMQFTVIGEKGFTPKQLPRDLNPTLTGDFPTLPVPIQQRTLTLIDVGGSNGPAMMLLDGQKYDAPVSEKPSLGTTEDWLLVNPTIDAHPIHIHLIQFQVVHRQMFNITTYMTDWTRLNGNPPLNKSTVNVPSFDPYFTSPATGPEPAEQAWKDTVTVHSAEVVTIRLRWTAQNGNPFQFDATAGPGYVWHCHLLEHEDNEMMRPYTIAASSQALTFEIAAIAAVALIVTIAVVVILSRRHRKG
jgi:FtsP/CotA-like multicopper oxidase with cupredoxin domain